MLFMGKLTQFLWPTYSPLRPHFKSVPEVLPGGGALLLGSLGAESLESSSASLGLFETILSSEAR